MNNPSRSIISPISVKIKSILSLVRRILVSEFLIASATATSVAEFLDKSPSKIANSVRSRALFNSSDFANEPDSVDLVKITSGSGGSFDFKESGKTIFNLAIGKVFWISKT